MMTTQQIVIFSHGFGVQRDDRGLFTELAKSLEPAFTPIMFDYNVINLVTNELTVKPLYQQAAMLRSVIDKTHRDHPEAIIHLIAHSQGCVVASLLAEPAFTQAIFLAPPAELSAAKHQRTSGSRPGSTFNIAGTSKFVRRDGSRTIVPAEYYKELPAIRPMELYTKFGTKTDLTVIQAQDDEVLGETDFSSLTAHDIQILSIAGDHDFTGYSREVMTEKVITILQS